jgi:hypothetical protein
VSREKNVKINPGGTVFNTARQCLLCTDDVVVLGLVGTIEDTTTLASQTGLTTNIFRTKYMIDRKK